MSLIVVGAGAAGMFAAITAARRGVSVQVLEATKKPMRKILQSGGGRCNVLHRPLSNPRELSEHYPRGNRELIGPFTSQFTQHQTFQWFENEGVSLKVEEDGRCFPVTDNSETVASALRVAAQEAGVSISVGTRVTKIQPHNSSNNFQWKVYVKNKRNAKDGVLVADACMLATGSTPAGFELAHKLDLNICKLMPSLFSFRLQPGHLLEGLQGVTFANAELSLLENPVQGQEGRTTKSKPTLLNKQRGALLITHRGISGPAALRLSSFAAAHLFDCRYKGQLRLNCLPGMSIENIRQELLAFRNKSNKSLVSGGASSAYPFRESIPRRVWQNITKKVINGQCDLRWNDLKKEHVAQLCQLLVNIVLPFIGKDTNKEEFVTAGGVDLKEISLKTCESKRYKNLYFGGEILNVDGVTGGFNFQACWTTGYMVGAAVSSHLNDGTE
jgi:predicted Rossmann fold flavoprotein